MGGGAAAALLGFRARTECHFAVRRVRAGCAAVTGAGEVAGLFVPLLVVSPRVGLLIGARVARGGAGIVTPIVELLGIGQVLAETVLLQVAAQPRPPVSRGGGRSV